MKTMELNEIGNSALRIENISKKFEKEKAVLNDINIDILPNSCFCLLGKNGAGKSTLFNILANLLNPDSGNILWKGKEINKCLKEFKGSTGFMLDHKVLINEFTGMQFLKFVASIYGLKDDTESKILKITDYFFENQDDLNKKIESYSSGMKQKLSFCSVILHKPDILILDEPFASLDAISSNRLIKFIKQYMKNRIVIISSHDLSYVEKIATHIGVLDEGELKFNGDKNEFIEKGEMMIEDALFKYIQPKEYSVSLEELSWLFN